MSSLYLQYGNYVHAPGECALAEQITQELRSGIIVGYRHRFDVQGRLQIDDQGSDAANQFAMTNAMGDLENAYAVNGLDFGLYQADGTQTAHGILNAATIGGVKVVSGPTWSEGRGAEYTTWRTYSLAVEGITPLNTVGTIAWHEVLNFRGGGPQYVYLETLVGPPQRQLVKEQTVYRATQQGRAVGAYTYPLPPAPFSPTYYLPAESGVVYESPELMGPLGPINFRDFVISWRYEFASDIPLLGFPNNWNPSELPGA